MLNFSFNRKPSYIRSAPAWGTSGALSVLLGLMLALAGSGYAEGPKTAEEWFKRANEMYQEGAVDEAIGSLQEALKLKPDYLDALTLLGAAYVESGEFAKAVEPYKTAVRLKPNDYTVLLGYSNALEGAGKQEDELPVLKTLFNLNKNDMVTGIKYLTLIEAAGREKHVADYIAVLEDLRRLPNFDPTYTAKLARAYNKTGDFPKAIGVYQELVAASPESGEYWAGLANAQAKVDPTAARESYKKAIAHTSQAADKAKLEKALAALGKTPATAPAAAPVVAAPVAPATTPATAPAVPVTPAIPSVPSTPVASGPSAAEKAKALADAKAKADADAKALADANANANAKAKSEADAKALADANAKAKADADAKALADANANAKAKADAAALALAEKKSQADAAAVAAAEKKAAADAKVKADADAKAKVEADKKALADAKAQAHADSLARAQAEKKSQADAAAVAAAEKKAAADAKAKADADAKAAALVQAQADKQAHEDAARLAREEASRKAQAHADSVAQAIAAKKAADLAAAADAKAKAEIEKQAREDAQKLAKEEAARHAKEHADSVALAQAEKKAAAAAVAEAKAKAHADSLAQVQADKQARLEAARLAKEEAARLAKERADNLAVAAAAKKSADSAAAADAKAQAEMERKAKEEALKLAKEEAARRAKERADSVAQVQAEKKAAAEAEALAKAEAQKLAKEDAARRAKERADSLVQVQAEKKAAAEAKAKADAEAKAAALAQAAAEKQAREEALRLSKEEAAQRARARADSLAQVAAEKKAAAEAEAKAKADALRLAKEEAAAKAKVRADSLAQVAAEKKAAAEAEAKAKAEAQRLAKEEADRRAKARADSLAQVAAEKKAAAEEAARLAKVDAERRAKARTDSLVRVEAEHKAKAEAERLAREEAARLAKEEADRRAKAKADSLARVEADRRAAAEAEQLFQNQLAALVAEQPMKMDTAAVLGKIQDRRATTKVPDQRLPLAEAVIHFHQWNFRPAVESLRKVKVLSPSGNRMMALALFELQDYANALKYFQKDPTVTADRVEWGKYIKTLLENKQRPEAASQYEAYLAKYPDADDALSFLVDYYRQPLQKEKLVPKLEMQLAKNPKEVALLTELIALTDKASPKAIEYRERYLQQNPDDAKQSLALAQAYEARNNVPAALKIYQRLAKDAPADKALNLKAAELLYASGQKDDAVKYFELAHSADPADKKLTLRLAGVYEERKQNDKAGETYVAALEADPKDKAVQAKLFQLYSAKDDKAQLRALLMKMDDADPTAHQAQYQLAKAFLADGDKDKAYVYLAKALRNQPANPEYLALLPSVVQSEEQVDAHFPALQSAAIQPNAKPELQALVARGYAKRKNNAMAAKLYADAYAKNPKLLEGQREAVVTVYEAKNMELSGALAEKYLLTDDKDRVIREIEVNSFIATNKPTDKLREAIKGLSALDPDAANKWAMRLAQLDLAARDTASAIEHAKDFLDKNPKNAEGWRFLAPLVAKRPGQEDTYISALEKLVQLEPANRGRYDLELANLYLAKGSYEEAEKSLLNASKASPANASLWFKLGETETKLRKDKEAAEKYQRAYLLDKGNLTYARAYAASVDSKDEIRANLPLFQLLAANGPSVDERRKLAQAYFLSGDYANAAKEFDALVKADASVGTSEPMVSEAYMRSGQTAKARGLFEARLASDPNNLPLLESIANIYKAEGNQAGYVATVEKIVNVDPKYKGYQLVLAVEKEKAKDYKGALEQYGQWVSRNGGDLAAVKSMHRLAEMQKDTTALMDALVRLNREKNPDNAYKFQLAELDFVRSANVGGVERLVKTHPEWKRGKSILVKEYLRQNAKVKLLPLQGFLLAESKNDRTLLEPLADLYVMQKKPLQANIAYHDLLVANPKDKDIYAKVYKYSAANNSPYLPDILRIGYESFPDDMDIKLAYAGTLGKTAKALAVYQEILAKETNVKVVAKALDIALALNQTQTAAALLDKWINIDSKDPK
ncbi:MAG: tetratricopeptide repeat protein, partial [Fibrobacteria bacterium]